MDLSAEHIAKQLGKAQRLSDGGWKCCCPGHEDPKPSLTLHAPGGKLLVRCHAGCEQARVIGALKSRGLWPTSDQPVKPPLRTVEKESWRPILPVPDDAPAATFDLPKYGPSSGRWTYRDTSGRLLGYVCRFDPPNGKQILPRVYCRGARGETAWRWLSFPKPRPLYNLHLLAKRPDASVIVVEGEKCADALAAALHDVVVVTWPGGAKAVAMADWGPLRGRRVMVWPDNDQPGFSAAITVGQTLRELNREESRVAV